MSYSSPADADSAAEGGGSPTPGVPSDTLTCGACRRAFALADIVRFIQHKISSCDKDLTSYHCYSAGKYPHSKIPINLLITFSQFVDKVHCTNKKDTTH